MTPVDSASSRDSVRRASRPDRWIHYWLTCFALLASPAFAFEPPGMEKVEAEEPAKRAPARPMARDFDIRVLDARGMAAQPAAKEDPLVQSRQAGAKAFQKRLARSNQPVRFTLNQFGLPKSLAAERGALSASSKDLPEDIAKSFLRARRELFPFSDAELTGLRLLRKETAHGLVFLRFNQTVNDVAVFQGLVRVVLNSQGQVVEAGADSVVPSLSLSTTPRLTPEEAVKAAYGLLELKPPDGLQQMEPGVVRGTRFEHPLGPHFSPIIVEPAIFPMDAKSGVLAFRILLEVDSAHWFEMLVDADSGRLLYLHNLCRQASGRVWRQSPIHGWRELVEFPPEWLPASAEVTTGNNADAYLDTNGDNKPDTSTVTNIKSGRAHSPQQEFDFPAGDRTTLQDPRNFKAASVTHLFYFVNLAHDYFYKLGFDEAAGNFQKDNFDRGGAGGDPVMAEAQDGDAVDNATMSTPPDGTSPRLQVGLNTYGLKDQNSHTDNAYEGETVFHEYAHGVTNRMVGAGTESGCLSGTQSRALGEGWSDYFAASYFDAPVLFAYSSLNRFHGLRRSSYQRYPYTYEDLGNHDFQVHNDGEIWAATLWDLRRTLGQEMADQLVVSGLRFAPCRPSMPDARAAIVTADENINAGANRATLWQVFAQHGLGYSASGFDGHWRQGTVFTAAYDVPPDFLQDNRPPMVSSTPIPPAVYGADFVYDIQAEDPDGGTLRYELVKGPAGMNVNPDSGQVRWPATFIGREVQIAVTDGQGGMVAHGFRLYVETPLSPGTPLEISAMEGPSGFATLDVPENTLVLQVTLRNGWGDADLWLWDPNGLFKAVSLRAGTTETLSLAQPKAGAWIIEVEPWRNFFDAQLAASLPVPIGLTIPTSLDDLSDDLSSETFYRVTVPAGEPSFRVSTSGGQGDVDLYVRRGLVPVCQLSTLVLAPCSYDVKSSSTGTSDSIKLTNPTAGDYYINLAGFKQYSGVTLTIPHPPILSVEPLELSFTAVINQPAPAGQTVRIVDAGGDPLQWKATAAVSSPPAGDWLNISPASGASQELLNVSVQHTGLAAGTYTGTITVTAAGARGSPQTVKVTLTVGAA